MAALIKRQLQRLLPGAEIFLDVDNLADISKLEEYIEASGVIVVILSRQYFASKNCLREIRAAVRLRKRILFVHEADPEKGGAPLGAIRAQAGDEFQHLFETTEVIRWMRVTAFQVETLRRIAEVLLLETKQYAKERELPLYMPNSIMTEYVTFRTPIVIYCSKHNPGAEAVGQELFEAFNHLTSGAAASSTPLMASHRKSICGHDLSRLACTNAPASAPLNAAASAPVTGASKQIALPNEILFRYTTTPPRSLMLMRSKAMSGTRSSFTVFSPSSACRRRAPSKNKSACDTVKAWPHAPSASPPAAAASPASTTPATPVEAKMTHFLLYLCDQTWKGEAGRELAAEVRALLRMQVQIVLLHENREEGGGCTFAQVAAQTPDDLMQAGIYSQIATPLHSGLHRAVSLVLCAKAMGAQADLSNGGPAVLNQELGRLKSTLRRKSLAVRHRFSSTRNPSVVECTVPPTYNDAVARPPQLAERLESSVECVKEESSAQREAYFWM